MPNKFLMREGAPFSQEFWQLLDETVMNVARAQLTGRKIVSVKGPFGLGLKHISLGEYDSGRVMSDHAGDKEKTLYSYPDISISS
ncbi:MAG TPA: hypothetical protein DHV12_03930 [Thermotogae bacterium]|nr:hypothetical protein [Thermotogota bacterium]